MWDVVVCRTCWGTYDINAPYWTNVTVNNAVRSWAWMTCNQLGWFQTGPPLGQPAIVSRILQPRYTEVRLACSWVMSYRVLNRRGHQRQCVNFFPDKFSSPPSPSTAEVNNMYGGWNVNVDRVFFANGRRAYCPVHPALAPSHTVNSTGDPWLGTTVSADGLNKANTTMQPIYESDGFHGSDIFAANGIVDETVHAVQMAGLEYMKMWLA